MNISTLKNGLMHLRIGSSLTTYESSESQHNQVEARLWAEYTLQHANPVLRQVGIFLITFYALEGIADTDELPRMDGPALNPLEVFETESWVLYFKNHSLEGLQEVSEFMPEWIGLSSES